LKPKCIPDRIGIISANICDLQFNGYRGELTLKSYGSNSSVSLDVLINDAQKCSKEGY
jgi:hypothetical protein